MQNGKRWGRNEKEQNKKIARKGERGRKREGKGERGMKIERKGERGRKIEGKDSERARWKERESGSESEGLKENVTV